MNARTAVVTFKNFNVDLEQSYRDYKKFRASSKIIGIGEVQGPK